MLWNEIYYILSYEVQLQLNTVRKQEFRSKKKQKLSFSLAQTGSGQ